MSKNPFKRLLSLVLVLALLVGMAVPTYAVENEPAVTIEQVDNSAVVDPIGREPVDEPVEMPAYADFENVRVSIILKDKSAIQAGYGLSVITEDEAVDYREELQVTQEEVTAQIEEAIQEELDVVWNLTLAANLISANVEYGQIETIEAIPGVEKVVIETRYEPAVVDTDLAVDPNMATSGAQIGSSTAWAAGYTGAGSKIAIIDTGADIEHISLDAGAFEYSLAQLEGSYDLLAVEDIAAVLDQLNVVRKYAGATADDLYYNSKVPFGFNYVDNDLDIVHVNDKQGEHGSHVAGIATANAYVADGEGGYVKALDEVFAQGVAPDAQLMVMKVFGKDGGAYDSDYMVAIEDAIVLGADSINLSLGSGNPGMSRNANASYQAILDSLTDAGAVVAMSAGNSGYWAENSYTMNMLGAGYLYLGDVSMQTNGSPGSFTNSLSVASVDNSGSTGKYLAVGDINAIYAESDYSNEPLTTIAGQHEYVLFDNTGAAEDGSNLLTDYADVTDGKVVFVFRGESSFYQKHMAVDEVGGIACIVCNNQPGIINMDLTDSTSTIPCVSITYDEAIAIAMASTPVFAEDGETVLYYTGTVTIGEGMAALPGNPEYYTMSSFSSWGIPGSLELKPEITAPGGNIYSINGAHDSDQSDAHFDHDRYENMSGTSMASPQVAGMAAVVAQYIRENDLTAKTGLSARQLAQSLLMSTAEPMLNGENGYYYPVLQQGAGLANVGSAVSAEAYILMGDGVTSGAADGKVKVELGDDPAKNGVYSASFTVNNMTDAEQQYELAADLFTQDVWNVAELGMAFLDTWTAPLSAVVTWNVDGAAFVPAAEDMIGMDFNADGAVTAEDANAILEYVVGNVTSLNDQANADFDDDGDIDSYDAYLFLQRLNKGIVTVPASGSVEITVTMTLTDAQKTALNDTYPTGAYVEGFIYVDGVADQEGIVPVGHSIPVLGFYGSWADPSMYDVGSYMEYTYDLETRPPYLFDGASYNALRANKFMYVDADEPGVEYVMGGNPLGLDDTYYPERDALNSADVVTSVNFAPIRNAADSMIVITLDGTPAASMPNGAVSSAYYYTNGGTWQGTSTGADIGCSADYFGIPEGYRLGYIMYLAPEYYMNDAGEVDWDSVMAGEGTGFGISYTIDNTAPVLAGVDDTKLFDNDGGTLDVTVKENQYLAGAVLYNAAGTTPVWYTGCAQENAGDDQLVSIPSEQLEDGVYLLQLADYAYNLSTYRVFINVPEVHTAESVTIDPESIVLIKGTSAALSATVLPENISDNSVTWTSSDESVATVDANGIITGVATGTCTITAASVLTPAVTGTCEVTVESVDITLTGTLQDEVGNPVIYNWNMAANDTWSVVKELDVSMISATANNKGQLYIVDGQSNVWSIHKVDAATGATLESYPNAYGVPLADLSFSAYSSDEQDYFNAVYYTYLFPVQDPANFVPSGFDFASYMATYTGGSDIVAIADGGVGYIETQSGTVIGEYSYLLDDAGYLWEIGVYPSGNSFGASLGIIPTNLRDVGYSVAYDSDYNPLSSMVAGEDGNFYLSAFDGSTNVLYRLSYDIEMGGFNALRIGDVGRDVWPATLINVADNGAPATAIASVIAEIEAVEISAEELAAAAQAKRASNAPVFGSKSAAQAPVGGLNAVQTPADQVMPMSDAESSKDENTITIEITAQDASGAMVETNSGKMTVTYDSTVFELASVVSHAAYSAYNDSVDGQVVFAYADLDTIAAGDSAATITLRRKADAVASDVVVKYDESGSVSSGYVETLPVDYSQVEDHSVIEIRGYSAPTCRENGYTGDQYCAKCGKFLRGGEILYKLVDPTVSGGAVPETGDDSSILLYSLLLAAAVACGAVLTINRKKWFEN